MVTGAPGEAGRRGGWVRGGGADDQAQGIRRRGDGWGVARGGRAGGIGRAGRPAPRASAPADGREGGTRARRAWRTPGRGRGQRGGGRSRRSGASWSGEQDAPESGVGPALRNEGVAGLVDGGGDVGAVDRPGGGDGDRAAGQVDGDRVDAVDARDLLGDRALTVRAGH